MLAPVLVHKLDYQEAEERARILLDKVGLEEKQTAFLLSYLVDNNKESLLPGPWL